MVPISLTSGFLLLHIASLTRRKKNKQIIFGIDDIPVVINEYRIKTEGGQQSWDDELDRELGRCVHTRHVIQ